MARPLPLYQRIVNDLTAQILANTLQPGDKIPTEFEIRDRYAVSRITATRAVKELESQGLVYREKGRGTFVRNRQSGRSAANAAATPGPDGAAQREREESPSSITVVLPFKEAIGIGVLLGVERVVRRFGYHTAVRNSSSEPRQERQIILSGMESDVAGLIIYPCSSVDNLGAFSTLIVRRRPFVLIDRRILGLETPLVEVDNERGSYEATNHLINLGHRNIAFVADAPVIIGSETERFHGYCRALVEAGIPVRDELVYDHFGAGSNWLQPTDLYQDDPSAVPAADSVVDYLFGLAQPPTAVIAVNDWIAMNVLKTALRAGIGVPDRVSIIGFDNLPFSAHLEVPLTTVQQPFEAIGERAALMVLQRIRDPRRPFRCELLEPSLVVRRSTAPPPATP